MAVTKTARNKVRIWIVIPIIIGLAICGASIAFLADAPGRQELQTLVIGDVDFTKLEDGTYTGEYNGIKGDSRNAAVEITVLNGEITGIKILKGALDSDGNLAELTGGRTVGDLFQQVVESETLQVDAISGATLTSKAHLKALENALRQAQKQ